MSEHSYQMKIINTNYMHFVNKYCTLNRFNVQIGNYSYIYLG